MIFLGSFPLYKEASIRYLVGVAVAASTDEESTVAQLLMQAHTCCYAKRALTSTNPTPTHPTCAHKHTHTHIRTHTYIHTHTHAHTQT